MKKHKLSAVKLFFLFATLGAFPFLFPAMQFQTQNMGQVYNRSFEVNLSDRRMPVPQNQGITFERSELQTLSAKALQPINPSLGPEVQPDSID